jgi:putative oxygen-independent coproporphyrinogen III oxidase
VALRADSIDTTRSGQWSADPGFGVYVHIPFCRHRCHYCDFNTYEKADALHGPYVDALVCAIESGASVSGRKATSVFFGGGTPTLLSPTQLARILEAVGHSVGIAPDAEITVEANPETVDVASLCELRAAGFNRLSIGVQSLVPSVLAGLGRTHSGERALEAIDAGRRAGFTDINADLIYGSPWETERDWIASLTGVIDAQPEHVSAYALTIESGTPLATLVSTGRVPNIDPDIQADRHGVAGTLLGAAGYERYEVSNWARPGYSSQHNVLYWCAGDYLGFGAGAHGHAGGRRYWSVRLPRDFIDRVNAGSSTEAGHEVLGPDERAGEALMLGLRLRGGLDVGQWIDLYGHEAWSRREATVLDFERRGIIERTGGRVRIASWAALVGDAAARELL